MGMRIGELRHQMTIQTRSATVDAYSKETVTWADLETVWADLVPIRPGEQYDDVIVDDVRPTHTIQIRYRTGVNPREARAVFGSRTFEVFGVVDPDERKRELHLLVVERT